MSLAMPLVFTPKNTKPARESRWNGFEKLEIARTTNRTANTESTAPRDGFELSEDICVATCFVRESYSAATVSRYLPARRRRRSCHRPRRRAGAYVWRITDFPRISNLPHTRLEFLVATSCPTGQTSFCLSPLTCMPLRGPLQECRCLLDRSRRPCNLESIRCLNIGRLYNCPIMCTPLRWVACQALYRPPSTNRRH